MIIKVNNGYLETVKLRTKMLPRHIYIYMVKIYITKNVKYETKHTILSQINWKTNIQSVEIEAFCSSVNILHYNSMINNFFQ